MLWVLRNYRESHGAAILILWRSLKHFLFTVCPNPIWLLPGGGRSAPLRLPHQGCLEKMQRPAKCRISCLLLSSLGTEVTLRRWMGMSRPHRAAPLPRHRLHFLSDTGRKTKSRVNKPHTHSLLQCSHSRCVSLPRTLPCWCLISHSEGGAKKKKKTSELWDYWVGCCCVTAQDTLLQKNNHYFYYFQRTPWCVSAGCVSSACPLDWVIVSTTVRAVCVFIYYISAEHVVPQ